MSWDHLRRIYPEVRDSVGTATRWRLTADEMRVKRLLSVPDYLSQRVNLSARDDASSRMVLALVRYVDRFPHVVRGSVVAFETFLRASRDSEGRQPLEKYDPHDADAAPWWACGGFLFKTTPENSRCWCWSRGRVENNASFVCETVDEFCKLHHVDGAMALPVPIMKHDLSPRSERVLSLSASCLENSLDEKC